jgi:hypothetical protein
MKIIPFAKLSVGATTTFYTYYILLNGLKKYKETQNERTVNVRSKILVYVRLFSMSLNNKEC